MQEDCMGGGVRLLYHPAFFGLLISHQQKKLKFFVKMQIHVFNTFCNWFLIFKLS